MDTNDDFYGKELNLNCFYMHTNVEQKYPKTAIVIMWVVSNKFDDISIDYRVPVL